MFPVCQWKVNVRVSYGFLAVTEAMPPLFPEHARAPHPALPSPPSFFRALPELWEIGTGVHVAQ